MDSTRNPVHVSFDGETPQSVPNTPTRSSDDVKKPRRVSSELNRTKKTARKSPAVKILQQKPTIASVRRSTRLKKVVEKSQDEPSLYRCSDKAFREILQCQNSTDLLIPKMPFGRVVREIGNNIKKNIRFKPVSYICLQEMSEAHLTDIFNKKDMLATHSKRVTIR